MIPLSCHSENTVAFKYIPTSAHSPDQMTLFDSLEGQIHAPLADCMLHLDGRVKHGIIAAFKTASREVGGPGSPTSDIGILVKFLNFIVLKIFF